MAHFAQLNLQNVVTNVISVSNDVILDEHGEESEDLGIDFCKSLLGNDTNWKQTSYNNNFRKHYAGIGYVYNEKLDAFIPPKPFPSWILNEDTCVWEPPIPAPNTDAIWHEEKGEWVENPENYIPL